MCASLCFLGLHSRFNPSLGASVAHAALFACLQGVRLVAERGRLMEDASAATAAEGHQRDDGPECMAAVRSTEVIQTRMEGTPERHCLVDGTLSTVETVRRSSFVPGGGYAATLPRGTGPLGLLACGSIGVVGRRVAYAAVVVATLALNGAERVALLTSRLVFACLLSLPPPAPPTSAGRNIGGGCTSRRRPRIRGGRQRPGLGRAVGATPAGGTGRDGRAVAIGVIARLFAVIAVC